MTRVAALDCGTNSLRLLIADVAGEQVSDVVREMEIVRLGAGVDRTGELSAAALSRTAIVLRRYAELVHRHRAERVRLVATSATRDARNRAEFVATVRDILGVDPEVVSGAEEAALSFAGAVAGVQGLPEPYLVVDIGGGSTEFVLGAHGAVAAARSVDIGCVRMTERHLAADPPTPAQVAAATADIDAAIATAARSVDLERAGTLLGLAGSVTTVAALALRLARYDPARIHHARIAAADVNAVAERLLRMPRAERAALPVMHPGRVDVIGAGALILARIVARTGCADVVASEHDILDGLALALAAA